MGDAHHIRRALELAAEYRTHPNPRVGAVVVDENGQVVGEGAHHGPGRAHAEVVALGKAGLSAAGARLYVTLEPCTHRGRTPPCVDSIIAAGISKVIVGQVDPDHRVSGAGIERLRDAGIDVASGVLADEVEEIDPGYFMHRREGMPRVVLKLAMTLDGAIAAADGTSQWITSEASREDAHRLRAKMDGVIIGAGTLRQDDPRLTARHEGASHQPRPVVIAGMEDLPPSARIWERDPIVVTSRPLQLPAGETVEVEPSNGYPDPVRTAQALGDMGLYDLMIEGGAKLAGSWWREGVITSGVLYLAGKVGGGAGVSPFGGQFATMSDARPVRFTDVQKIGPDLRIEFV